MLKRMISALLAICLIVPVIHLDAFASEVVASSQTVTIFEIEGDNVRTTRGTAREFAARTGTRLHNGYTVNTGAGSFCTLRLDDGSLLKMDEKSTIQISTASRNKLSVTVLNGGLLVDAAPQQDTNTVDIRVGSSVLSIRGTFFAAENHPDGSAIYTMFEGSGDVDGVRLSQRHIMNVHETASSGRTGTLARRDRELTPLEFSNSSVFVLGAILADTDRFIGNGVITQGDIPGLAALLSERQEEERNRPVPPAIDGVRRFFSLLETGSGHNDSGNGGNSVSINYAPLHTALNNARNAKLGVFVDTSAFNVSIGSHWVTRAVMDDFDDAIDAAEALLGTKMTVNQISAAAAALDALRTAFIAARNHGAKPDVDNIHAVLYGAGDFIDMLNISVNGMDIPFGEPWITQDLHNELNTALAAFEAALQEFELALAAMGIQWQIRAFSFFEMNDEILQGLYQNLLAAIAHLNELIDTVEAAIASPAGAGGGIGENTAITIDNTAREVVSTANDAVRGVVVASAANDVPADRQWVTPAAMNTLNNAIEKAREDLAEDRTQQITEVEAAFTALEAAQAKVAEAQAKLEAALEKAAQAIIEAQEENEETLAQKLKSASEIDSDTVNRLIEDAMVDITAAAHTKLAPVHTELAAAHAGVAVQFAALTEVREEAAIRQKAIADTLDEAIIDFNSTKQWGTIPVHVNKTLLSAAIVNAYDAKSLVNVSNDSDGVLRGEEFVPRQALTALNTRIREAERVWQDSGAVLADIERVTAALNEAVILFKAAKETGTRDLEIGRLMTAIMSAVEFVTDTNVDDDNGKNTPFDERWVSAASMTDFAGVSPKFPITNGAIDFDNIIVGGILEQTFIILESAFVGDIMQTDVDDAAVELNLAQWECYASGDWGSAGIDLFPEDGPAVWQVKRADGSYIARMFSNPYNAQVAAGNGDTLILTGSAKIDGMLLLFKDINIIVNADIVLTLNGSIAFRGTFTNNGTVHLAPAADSMMWPWLSVVSGATFINTGTVIIEPSLPGALRPPALDINGKTPQTVFDPNSQAIAFTSFGFRYAEGMFCPTGAGTLEDGRFINEPAGTVINRSRINITGEFENKGTLHNDGLISLEENTIDVVSNPNWAFVMENNIPEPALFDVPAIYISNGSLSSPGKIISGEGSEIRIKSAGLSYSHPDGFTNNGELNILRSGTFRSGIGISQPGGFPNLINPLGGSFELAAGTFTNNGSLFVDGGNFGIRASYIHSSTSKIFTNNGRITIVGSEEAGPGLMTPGSDVQAAGVTFTSSTPGATFRVLRGEFASPSWNMDKFREADGSPLTDNSFLPAATFTWDGGNWLLVTPPTLDTAALQALIDHVMASFLLSILFGADAIAAQSVLETATTQEEIDVAFDTLWNELVHNLYIPPAHLLPSDRTALNTALSTEETLGPRLAMEILMFGRIELLGVLGELNAAYEEAKAVRPSASQTKVDEVTAALNAVIMTAEIALADKSLLQVSIIEAVLLKEQFDGKPELQTELDDLTGAIEAAEAVNASTTAIQSQIDTATATLNIAIVTARNALGIANIDTSELQNAIDEANIIVTALYEEFSATWDLSFAFAAIDLENAITAAEAVRDAPLSMQTDIDAAVLMLLDAIALAEALLGLSLNLNISSFSFIDEGIEKSEDIEPEDTEPEDTKAENIEP
ncbi:MAG: FecR domain-containing protein [Lachnospiraceae bacterium]|nr:FecR domain-containing protein [Lachnospiraceae bacterium]